MSTIDREHETIPSSPPPSPKPPRGPSTGAVVAVVVAFALALLLGVRYGDRIAGGWHKVIDAVGGHKHAAADAKRQAYTCGMHPWVIQWAPGDCPICRMELTPIDPAKFTGKMEIDPVVVQNMGVRVEPVKTGPLVRTIRTVGTVDYDETRVRDVSTKIGGWVEKLHVDSTGARVKQGDVLFELYSPELFTGQQEYLLAWRNQSNTATQALAGTAGLLESARTKLLYYDIAPEQITELEKSGQPAKTMAIRARTSGVITEKMVNEGQKIEGGMRLYRIADLSKVWVMVTIYEYQLPYIQVGQTAAMTLPYIPGQTFEGKVVYVYPYLNEKTREVKVRLEFDNADGMLRPGMFANVELKNTLAQDRVLAPRTAIIDTGTRQVAFVSLGEGKFEPRDVHLGIETQDGQVEVRDGLKVGEMVVTSGQFLLDSEAKIREALAKMIKGDLASDQKPVVATLGASDLAEMPEAMGRTIGGMLDAYFAISESLASDKASGFAPHARTVAGGVDALLKMPVPGDEHFWHKHEEAATVRGKALELIDAPNIEQARLKFADLSVAMSKLLKATGVPPMYGKEVQELHCPMYLEGQGGSVWLQPAGAVRNPYMGSSMLECFDKRFALPVTGKKVEAEPALKAETPVPAVAADPHLTKHVDAILKSYYQIAQTLTENKTDGVSERLTAIALEAEALAKANSPKVAELGRKIGESARSEVKDLGAARAIFESISNAALELVKLSPPTAPAYHAYCPMVKKSWLQDSEPIRNAYAPYMLTCGTIKEKIGK